MSRLNEALDRSIRDRRLSNEDVVKAIGLYTAAAIGNYRKGKRKVPSDLVEKWKEVYNEDLHEAAKTNGSISKTNVSRGTQQEAKHQQVVVNRMDEDSHTDIHKVLLETVKSVNKLLDQNSVFIAGKDKEVDRLDRDKNWAFGQIEKLQAKLGIPKES